MPYPSPLLPPYGVSSVGRQVLFRSVAMTHPDRELIAQVLLYSQGFRTAEALARKCVPLFHPGASLVA